MKTDASTSGPSSWREGAAPGSGRSAGRSRPKQFLDIVSAMSMIEETVERLAPLVAPRDVLTIADAGQTESLRRLLPGLPRKNFVVEPLARNTAPSLMLATARVYLEDPEAVVAALAADHLIRDPERFRTVLEAGAARGIQGRSHRHLRHPADVPVHRLRIHPLSPEAKAGKVGGEPFFPVLEFKEKPDRATAEAFLADGSYYGTRACSSGARTCSPASSRGTRRSSFRSGSG